MYSDELKILKPGQTGFGIMIEQDAGYISPNDIRNKPFLNEMQKLGEGKGIMIEPLIVYAVLQKYGVENRNGRIYPEAILKREVEKYQQLIREKRAIGECVPIGTEIFTKNGWKRIEETIIGEEILTLNINSDQLEFQKITNTTKKMYNDDMIHIYNNSSFDIMVTKKHKIVLWDRNNKPYILTGEELYNKLINNDSKISHSYIKHSANWIGKEPEYFNIPNSDIKIKTEHWAAFLGIFLSEGHCSGSKGGKKKNLVCITQKKEETKEKIINLLNKLPFKYSISGNRQFNIYDDKLYEYLFELGNSHEKHIPSYAKEWSKNLLNILLDWLLIGDGKNRKNRKNSLLKEYFTTSNKLAEDVFEIMLKLGNGATMNVISPVDREIEGRIILGENSKPLHLIHERTSKGIYMDTRYIKTELVPFNENVYCVTVPNGTWLMRYNGKISWTHNSDHPETSIISNDRISHNILETWWEGKTLLGKLEIIMSPGFINQGIISCQGDQIANLLRKGIMVGVSSRGVGSLEEVAGKHIVQDDFELICWDIVTSPSTPGSWIFNKKEDMRGFSESKINKKPILIDKLNKFLS